MKKVYLLLALVGFGILSCSEDDNTSELPPDSPDLSQMYFPPVTTQEWEKVSISDLGWNGDEEQSLYDFLENNNTKAFIILKNGRIVVEKYFNDGSASENYPWYSAGKTLTATLTGIAQQEGLLQIDEPSSLYLGSGWANITDTQESQISIRNHLTMTTGLDYNVANTNCTDADCLTYLNEAGTFWYYHNAAYTLLTDIVSSAANTSYNNYFNSKIGSPIGMDGTWLRLGYAHVFYSTARSMARFGLLSLNEGSWENTNILTDTQYFEDMTSISQDLNAAYGYLWWLNGSSSYRVPASETQFNGELIPDASQDLIAGLGKDDQKLYVVPSQNLVIVRLGDNAGASFLGPSSFDNELWQKINLLIN